MKKFLLLMAVTLTLGLTTRAADGDEFTVDNLNYRVLSEEGQSASLVGYEVEPTGELVIPLLVKNGSSRYAVTTIGKNALRMCKGLTAVTIPNTVTTIADHAFARCEGLTTITLPNSLTSIDPLAFGGCWNMKEISVAEGNTNYTSVDGVLFNKAKTSIIIYPKAKGPSYEIPNSVTTIANYAFLECQGLTSVTIPNSVTSIGNNAFGNIGGLTTVYCYALIPPTIDSEAFEYVITNDIILHVVKGSEAAYKEADVWKDFFILGDLAPQSGIEGIEADGGDAPAEFFNPNGVRVNGEALTPGLYIKRQGGNATKVLVK